MPTSPENCLNTVGIIVHSTYISVSYSYISIAAIVVDAITDDGHLRVECKDEDGDYYVEEAICMYEYEKHDDYHNAFDGDRFKRWAVSFFYLRGTLLCTLVSPLY